MQRGATAGRTQIVTPQGKRLTWDDDDRLWLLRAVEAEGAPRDLVAQVLVNRWAWLWDRLPGKFTRLSELVRAYAQPVNPAWYPEGRLYQQQAATLTGEQARVAAQRAAKRRDEHSARTRFSAHTMAAVDRALFGPLTLPPGALHFAAPSIARPDLQVLMPAPTPQSNVIYADPAGAGARYALAREDAQHTAPSAARGKLLAALGIGVGLGAALALRRK